MGDRGEVATEACAGVSWRFRGGVAAVVHDRCAGEGAGEHDRAEDELPGGEDEGDADRPELMDRRCELERCPPWRAGQHHGEGCAGDHGARYQRPRRDAPRKQCALSPPVEDGRYRCADGDECGPGTGRTLIDAAQRAQGATETGMSASEFVVLRDLFVNGQSSISEIIARTDIAQSRVSVCIKQLVARGWVLTTTDPADGRKTLASVTERVEDEGARRAMNAQDALAPLLAQCPIKERRAITDALERLYELAVDAGDETLTPRHMGTTSANTQRRDTADAPDEIKTNRSHRTAKTRAERKPH